VTGQFEFIIKEIKNVSECIVELYKHVVIFKNTREVLEALGCASCFSMHFCRVLKITTCLNNSIMHSDTFFISLIMNSN